MATGAGITHKEGSINTNERFMRVAIAIVMFTYPLVLETSPIDLLALLPLMAIYPMFTAIVGWDPVLFAKETAEINGKTKLLRAVARIILLIIGTMMIVIAVTIPGKYIGWYSVLALLAIVPITIAIMAENPIQTLRESNAALRNNHKAYVEQSNIGEPASELVESAVNRRGEQNKRAA